MSFAYLERCFRAQSGGDVATAFDGLDWCQVFPHDLPHAHDPAELAALTHGLAPNLLVWTGRGHQIALSLKWDYVPVTIRREAEKR